MEVVRADGRTPNQLRSLACSRNLPHRAHGSARWSQGDTIVLAAVYGQRLEPEWVRTLIKPLSKSFGSPKLGRLVVGDDGALLPCAINASCAALVDASIPLKHLSSKLDHDPTKAEEEKMQAFAYLVFSNSPLSILPKASLPVDDEPGIITSVTHGLMSDSHYINCLEHGHAACAKILEFLSKSLQTRFRGGISKGTLTILSRPGEVQHLGAYFAATPSNGQVWSLIWTILATRNYDLRIQDDSWTKCRAYELRGLRLHCSTLGNP